MSANDLNMQVTEAILAAEQKERTSAHSQETKDAFAVVSGLEERLVREATTSIERNIARRGAITAALKADNLERARRLLEWYEDSPEFDTHSNRAMRDLYTEAVRSTSSKQ